MQVRPPEVDVLGADFAHSVARRSLVRPSTRPSSACSACRSHLGVGAQLQSPAARYRASSPPRARGTRRGPAALDGQSPRRKSRTPVSSSSVRGISVVDSVRGSTAVPSPARDQQVDAIDLALGRAPPDRRPLEARLWSVAKGLRHGQAADRPPERAEHLPELHGVWSTVCPETDS